MRVFVFLTIVLVLVISAFGAVGFQRDQNNWQTKIEDLEKENAALRLQVDSQRRVIESLETWQVEHIAKDFERLSSVKPKN